MNLEQDLLTTLASVSQALDAVGVRWAIGSSFASAVHGEPRLTNDIDVIACLRAEHVVPFRRGLGDAFYANDAVIHEAITARESFNLIDERTIFKVDIFVPAPGVLGEGQLDKRRAHSLSESGPSVFVLAPEDTVLQKLRWYELGNRVSDRQWRDLVSVVRLASDLDIAYMRTVAAQGNLTEVLEQALREGAVEKR